MSKKDKKECSVAEDLEAVMTMIPKLEGLIKTHKEITKAYQMYRKNGGDEIPGLEKHLGSREQCGKRCEKKEKITKNEVPEKIAEAKKTKKKDQ